MHNILWYFINTWEMMFFLAQTMWCHTIMIVSAVIIIVFFYFQIIQL